MRLNFFILLTAFAIFLHPMMASSSKKNDEAIIGVLAFRSKADTLKEWQPLANYLNRKIVTHHFIIRPLSYAEFNQAAASDELDFMFTNPEHYIYLSAKYDASRMATLIRANVGGKELTEFGGVIIARSDRDDIKTLADIKGKNIAAVDELSLGGYLAQRVLLNKNGIDIVKEAAVEFTDMPHDKVVYIVESGTADVGFIRSGVLEKMAKEGKIDRNDFKIIHPMDNFPQALSTVLYPEWPFASSKHTDRILANHVGVALLNLPYGSEIPKSAGYYGWNIPLSYEGIRTLMQQLRIKPYDNAPVFILDDVIRKYALYLIVFFSGLSLLLGWLAWRLRALTFSLQKQFDLLKENENYLRRAAGVFHNSREGIIITDRNKVIIDVNEAFCQLTGFSSQEVIGQKPLILRSGMHDARFYQELQNRIERDGSWRGEIWNRKKDGTPYAEFLRIDSIRSDDGKVENYIGIFSDITEHKQRQDQLYHMANYDSLTNLPNRHLYMTLADQLLSLSKRKGTKALIAFLDLDGFKEVNDTYGHEIGDRILKRVADRLEEQLRESDTIARIGGDEFIILLSELNAFEEADPLLQRILFSLQEPFVLNSICVGIGASIGATFFPDDGNDIDTLVRQADAAMYRSKETGRNRITYYKPEKKL